MIQREAGRWIWFRIHPKLPETHQMNRPPPGSVMLYCDLFITSVFGCLSAVQASIEPVEMTEMQSLLCRGWISEPGTIDDENESGSAGLGGVVTRVKDRCHTEPGMKSGTALRRTAGGRGAKIPNSLHSSMSAASESAAWSDLFQGPIQQLSLFQPLEMW